MSLEYKVAFIGVVGAIIVALITLIPPSLEPDLKLIGSTVHVLKVGHDKDVFSLIDIKLKNSGEDSTYLTKVEVAVLELESLPTATRSCGGCHITSPSATYSVDLSLLDKGKIKPINISHTIQPKKTDRFVIALKGDKSLVSRVRIIIKADEDTIIESKPLNIIIVNQGGNRGYNHTSLTFNKIVDEKLTEELTRERLLKLLGSNKMKIPIWVQPTSS